jgi:HD-GYP domain-containing protein (c-di-GMP phosphodiesterase class II)
MICGKRIVGKNGQLLLNRGTVLQDSYILKIREMGYSGIYIDDQYSRDILIDDIISDTLRANSVKAIKEIHVGIAGKKANTIEKMDTIHLLVDEILSAVISNKGLNVNLMDLKIFDDYTYYHSVNVGVLAVLVGTAMNMNRSVLHSLGVSAMMHDIGKVFIPKKILNKPGKLSNEEFELMKSHSERGFDYLHDRYAFTETTLEAILDHHERNDGTGYPHGKAGAEISRFGRIIAIADVFDALTSDRPYRSAMSPSAAIEFIMAGADTSFDMNVLQAFLERINPYSPGTTIKLSNNSTGIVLKNHRGSSLRPVIRIIREQGKEITPYDIDLMHDRNTLGITIVGTEDI